METGSYPNCGKPLPFKAACCLECGHSLRPSVLALVAPQSLVTRSVLAATLLRFLLPLTLSRKSEHLAPHTRALLIGVALALGALTFWTVK